MVTLISIAIYISETVHHSQSIIAFDTVGVIMYRIARVAEIARTLDLEIKAYQDTSESQLLLIDCIDTLATKHKELLENLDQ